MRRFLGMALAFGLMAPGLAQPKTGLEVQVKPFSDRVEIEVRSSAPLDPQLKANELRVGKGPIRSGAGTVRVDKGLIQKVEVTQLKGAGGAEIRVFTISNPKASVRLSADKRILTYILSVNDLASAGGGAAQLFGPKSPPVAAKSPPPVAAKSPSPVAANSPSQLRRDPLPAATPAPTPESTPQVRPTPTQVAAAQRPVSLTFSGGDLASALEALAKAAGLQAEIGPGVQGFVTASFTEIPLNQAVTTMLGQQSSLYEYVITDTHLKVFGDGSGGGSTVRSGRTAREYFPVKDPRKAADVLASLKKAVPELTYSVDERLNQILAEGDPQDLERARKALKSVSDK